MFGRRSAKIKTDDPPMSELEKEYWNKQRKLLEEIKSHLTYCPQDDPAAGINVALGREIALVHEVYDQQVCSCCGIELSSGNILKMNLFITSPRDMSDPCYAYYKYPKKSNRITIYCCADRVACDKERIKKIEQLKGWRKEAAEEEVCRREATMKEFIDNVTLI
jgi:hypothetical protein